MADNGEKENCRDPSPDDVARSNQHKVREAVKNIQSREAELPISPVPKPRRISPAPSPKQPKKNLSSAVPERVHKIQEVQVTPPASPMRRRSDGFKGASAVDGRPKPPVRKRRKKFVANGDDDKEGSNRNSAEVNPNSVDGGDYVNLSFSEGNVDFEKEGEVGDGRDTRSPAVDTHTADYTHRTQDMQTAESEAKCRAEDRHTAESEGREQRKGLGEPERERERFESFVMVGDGDDSRASAMASPEAVSSLPEEEEEGEGEVVVGEEVTVRGEEGEGVTVRSEDSELKRPPSSSQSSTSSSSYGGPSPDVTLSPTAGYPSSDTPSPIAEAVAEDDGPAQQPQPQPRVGMAGSFSLHQSGKKRPPPLPAPYQARPPPVPLKQRSVMIRRQLTDSVVMEMNTDGNKSVATATDSAVTVETTAPTPMTAAGIVRQLSLGNPYGLQPPKAPPPRPPSPQFPRRSPVSPSGRQALSPAPPTSEGAESPGPTSGGSTGGVLTAGNSVEVRVLTSRPETMPKHLSNGSSDSLELSEGQSFSSESTSVCVCVCVRAHVRVGSEGMYKT